MSEGEPIRATKEAAIRAVVEAFMDSWNRHDMEAHAAVFAVDADFVDVFGTLLRGRREIHEQQGQRHTARFSKSTVRTLDLSIRFIRPDVAIVHHWWEMIGDAGPDGKGAPPRKGIFSFVVSGQGDHWEFQAAHNSDLKQP